MNYQIYQLEFRSGVHFGNGSLDTTEISLCADSVCSALCIEALRLGEEHLEKFVRLIRENRIRISDAFPYRDGEWYLPKPMLPIESSNTTGDSVEKKRYKQLTYIPVSLFDRYLQGTLPLERANDIHLLGKRSMKISAAVRGKEETLPYRIETFRFHKDSGLYIIAGFMQEEDKAFLDELLEMLSLSGVGGKRSSGLGRFSCRIKKVPNELLKRLEEENGSHYMTLSVALPKEEEMLSALEGADYQLIRRSGYVYSDRYAEEQMRKRDLYVFSAGSCFRNRYEGDLFDVSEEGRHPVYRYAKPMFLGVD